MGAFEDFDTVVHGTDVIKRVKRSLTIEAALALREICREFDTTSKAVPDHRLSGGGYMGEMIVRALVEAGLIEETLAERRTVRQYQPTDKGRSVFSKLQEEQAFSRKA